MSVLKARSRLVSFRLTQEELENLRLACLIHGARNISDFARSAVLQVASSHVHPEAQVLDRFSAIEMRLMEIESTLKQQTDITRTLLKSLVNQVAEQARGA